MGGSRSRDRRNQSVKKQKEELLEEEKWTDRWRTIPERPPVPGYCLGRETATATSPERRRKVVTTQLSFTD